jgi:hypothetical protein
MAKIAVAFDRTGSPRHGDNGDEHRHAKPSYTDEQVKLLESLGYRVERSSGAVFDPAGRQETAVHVASILFSALSDGSLKFASSAAGESVVTKGVSGPGEAAPVVQHLDLRKQP